MSLLRHYYKDLSLDSSIGSASSWNQGSHGFKSGEGIGFFKKNLNLNAKQKGTLIAIFKSKI